MKKIPALDTDLGKYTLVFTDHGNIETSQLADFLFLFRGIYAAGVQAGDSLNNAACTLEPEVLADLVLRHLRTLDVSAIDSLFETDLGPYRLMPERMSYESPMELVMMGLLSAIVAAVILSGGKIQVVGVLKAQLPAMGEGIKKLREALTGTTRTSVGYGIKSRKIKLSKQEYTDLMRQDRTQQYRGGFQRFLVGLQNRVNQQTKVLELTEKDMDRILRYGRQPRRGGWQARIRGIFGRHFDLDDNI